MRHTYDSTIIRNCLDSSDNELEITHFLFINFMKVIDGNNVKFFDNFIGLIIILSNNLSIFNLIGSSQRGVNKTFSIR